ncbi:MAG: hypothetical protein V2A79_03810 [Planctomycetota bacterium]
MGTEAAALYIKVDADVDKAVAAIKHVDQTVDQIAGNVEKRSGKLSQILTGIGQGMGQMIPGMVEQGMGQVVGFIGGAVDAASNLNETVSKVGAVFLDEAPKVLAFGETAAQALGMAKEEALAGAATFGNLFVSMGMAQDKSADMSTSLVTLAADLASFNNIDPTVALEKLRAGLTGEAEPLKSLGVNMNETTIKAKAMELGLISATTQALDPAAKAEAAYAIILEQTATAQGDRAKTADQLAGSQRTMNAEIKDAMAELGQTLLPLVTEGVHALTMVIPPLAEALKGGVEQVAQFVQKLSDLAGIVPQVVGELEKIPGVKVATDIKASADAFQEMGNKALFGAEALGQFAGYVPVVGDAMETMTEQVIATVDPAIAAMADLKTQGGGHITAFAGSSVGAMEQMHKEMKAEARTAARDVIIALADNLAGGADAVESAANDLVEAQKKPIATTKRIAALEATLTGKALADGLKSADPIVREKAEALKQAASDEIAALKVEARRHGKDSGEAHAAGLGSTAKDNFNAANTVVGETGKPLKGAANVFYGYGDSAGDAYGRGVAAGIRSTKTLVDGSVAYLGTSVRATSPPGPESPLHLIDVWGHNTGEAWTTGFLEGMSGVVDETRANLAALAAMFAGAAVGPSYAEIMAPFAGGSGSPGATGPTYEDIMAPFLPPPAPVSLPPDLSTKPIPMPGYGEPVWDGRQWTFPNRSMISNFPADSTLGVDRTSVTVTVPVQNFYGTADNIAELSRQIAQHVRLAMPRTAG